MLFNDAWWISSRLTVLVMYFLWLFLLLYSLFVAVIVDNLARAQAAANAAKPKKIPTLYKHNKVRSADGLTFSQSRKGRKLNCTARLQQKLISHYKHKLAESILLRLETNAHWHVVSCSFQYADNDSDTDARGKTFTTKLRTMWHHYDLYFMDAGTAIRPGCRVSLVETQLQSKVDDFYCSDMYTERWDGQ